MFAGATMSEFSVEPAVDFKFTSNARRLGFGRTAEVFEWSPGWVVKLFYPNHPLAGIEREAAIAKCVSDAAKAIREFRVPAVGGIVDVADRKGLLFQRLTGEPFVNTLRGARAAAIDRAGVRLAELQFALHRMRVDAHAGLSVLPQQCAMHGGFIQAAPGLPSRLRESALRALAALGPSKRQLCHGDFQPRNVLLSGDGDFTLIDWLTATQGDAIADLARTSILLRFGRVADKSAITPVEAVVRGRLHDAYLERYFELADRPDARMRLEQWMPVVAAARLSDGLGSAERAQLLALVEKLR
jgi:hypothetical protein